MNGRYHSLEFLVQGGLGTTYKAQDQDDRTILLKELHLRLPSGMPAAELWKAHDLFQREAAVLRQLQHPQIPRFIESFTAEENGETRFFLVQEYLPYKSLEQLLQEGRLFREEEVKQYAGQVLAILEYLHSFSPPLIHRDVKPSNLLLDENEGKIYLVDFGSVGFDLAKTLGGSTMTGSPGYAPIEQWMGKPIPASDIYSLGATLLRVLARKEPGDCLAGTRLKIPELISSPLKMVLETMTEPEPEKRYQNAAVVQAALEGRALPARQDRTLEMAVERYKNIFHPLIKSGEAWTFTAAVGLAGGCFGALYLNHIKMIADDAYWWFFLLPAGAVITVGLAAGLNQLWNKLNQRLFRGDYQHYQAQYAQLQKEVLAPRDDFLEVEKIVNPLPALIADSLLYDFTLASSARGNHLEARLASLRIQNETLRQEAEKNLVMKFDFSSEYVQNVTTLPGMQRVYFQEGKKHFTDKEGQVLSAQLAGERIVNLGSGNFRQLYEALKEVVVQGNKLQANAFSFSKPGGAHGCLVFTISYYQVPELLLKPDQENGPGKKVLKLQ